MGHADPAPEHLRSEVAKTDRPAAQPTEKIAREMTQSPLWNASPLGAAWAHPGASDGIGAPRTLAHGRSVGPGRGAREPQHLASLEAVSALDQCTAAPSKRALS